MMRLLITLLFVCFVCGGGTNKLLRNNNTEACDQIFFGFDSSKLSEESRKTLMRQAQWLRKYDEFDIELLGYCDSKGSKKYNYYLGQRRAKAAAEFLESQGISSKRIKIVSKGRVSNEGDVYNPELALHNRRVDTKLVSR